MGERTCFFSAVLRKFSIEIEVASFKPFIFHLYIPSHILSFFENSMEFIVIFPEIFKNDADSFLGDTIFWGGNDHFPKLVDLFL